MSNANVVDHSLDKANLPNSSPHPEAGSNLEVETVGVIVVHGIGEQQPGDHMEGVVRALAEGLEREDRKRRVTVVTPENVESGDPQAWITVRSRDGDCPKLTWIGVHEVHWADVNESASLTKGILFWFWGLSIWLARGLKRPKSPLFERMMALPCFPNRKHDAPPTSSDRIQLFIVAWIFFLAAPVLVTLNFIAKRVFGTTLPATLETLVSYVSAVRLYTQPRRVGPGLLESCNEAPRYAIRRRMARVLADVASRGCGPSHGPVPYDRWYVLAHSQGTVVAFNGLQATGIGLAAYLDRERLDRLQQCGLAGQRRGDHDGPTAEDVADDQYLAPALPADRLGQDSVVYREQLFRRFYGLLTYGSPLDKFAGIWPRIVALNRWAAVFPAQAQWVNVWDPTDPVGAELNAFNHNDVFDKRTPQRTPLKGAKDCKPLEPYNVACKAHPVLLASHVYYLQDAGGGPQPLARWIGDWLLGHPEAVNVGKSLQQLSKKTERKRKSLMLFWVAVLIFILLGLMPVLLLWFVDFIAGTEFSACSIRVVPNAACGWQLLKGAAWCAGVTLALVIVAGPLGRLIIKWDASEERGGMTPSV
ncbi:MAG TPA: hypothetical protein VHL31_17500 [Geminicoccus sp.]|jgi:hypothetical protein|uniref:hypothetical protein n=1 Tax=Geminicoccus sp. TaxID=2024832 RepID=UPI002E32B0B0|nr:hypothetical protein [Geminicoccus sp.]HEX2528082.1 hypothetical protein [Geminicoccus sp.]